MGEEAEYTVKYLDGGEDEEELVRVISIYFIYLLFHASTSL
jgi:hypothetical protein